MRENIDDYFLRIVEVVGSRGTCNRGKSGSIIVKDKNILGTGYVGAVAGMPHCDDENHDMENNSCIKTAHAESNVICQAARRGISVEGATIYSTMFPCFWCAKMIVNSGIIRIVSDYDYHKSQKSKEMFDYLRIEYVIKNKKTLNYGSKK